MAQIVTPHIWYPDGYPGTAYDLREAVTWHVKSGVATTQVVRFVSGTIAVVEFEDGAAFEAAKQNSLDNNG